MRNAAVILGGGVGARFKGEVPKQFLTLGTKPIVVHTVEAFQRSPSIDAILVVAPDGWVQRCTAMLMSSVFPKVHWVIKGGETRQLSCWGALQKLKDDPPQVVIVHDAVRPLVTGEMIEAAVREGREGMTFGLRAVETVATCIRGEMGEILPREQVCQIQTPQAFPFSILWDAHVKAREDGVRDASDDAGLVLRAGYAVKVVDGDPRNIKITDQIDLDLAQRLLQLR